MPKLNPNQRLAVTHPNGPLLIIAGAGTGKTTVITERIKWLIQTQNNDPHRLFAATFTQKAAEEMLSRLDQVMPFGYQEPWLGTFHSLAEKLLRIEGLEIGLNPNFKIMTATDQWLFLKQNLTQLHLQYYRPLGNPNKFISALIKFFSRLQDEAVYPTEFLNLINHKTANFQTLEPSELTRLTELAQAYAIYEQLKRDQAVMDFGDLILSLIQLFHQRPHLLKKYQHYFTHVLVDEFQDTNYAQFEIIKLLCPASTHPNLTVVGDDDQSVYKFRGASVANILDFKSLYPNATEVILTQNYRSNQPILDAAYRVINHNNPERLETKLKLNKKLIASTQTKNFSLPPQIISFATLDDEVNWTVQKIIDLVTLNHINYQDIAILTRSNASLDPYVQALKTQGIPFQLISNRGLYEQPEIKTLIDFFRVLIDPHDSLSLFSLSQNPFFMLHPAQIFHLLASAKKTGSSLWDQLQSAMDPASQKLIATINRFQTFAATNSVTRLLYQFVLDTGYINQFIQKDSLENQLKIKNLNLFFNRIKQFETVSKDRLVVHFLEALELWLTAGEDPGQAQIEDVDTISLMTVHAAKGLEFSAVFVGSLIAGRFPSSNRKEPIEIPPELIKETIPSGDINLQEERRLFYVAMTRAKHALFLTFATNVGGVKKRQMSGFLTETSLPITEINNPPSFSNLSSSTTSPKIPFSKNHHFQLNSISYSKLDTFKVCPLKYKYRYLLHLPAKPHHAMSFGKSIHTTLQLFHQQEMQGHSPNLKTLLTLYRDNFIEEGYDSPTFKLERYQAGVKALTQYFHTYRQVLGQPVMLEQQFQLKLGQVTLIGKIDRLEKETNDTYAIVDYKTGEPKSQQAVNKDEQLTLYALAASEALKLKVNHLSLYFLEGDVGKVTTTRTPIQLQKAKEKLIKTISLIKQSKFPPKPSEFTCKYCEFNRLCPFAARRQS